MPSIPVPRHQPHSSRRPSLTAQQAAQQANTPWRSSLDLVWSYSRSQAFYGDNIGTSPSFVDRRWAGNHPHEHGDTSDSFDDEDEDIEEVDDEEYESETDEDEHGELPPPQDPDATTSDAYFSGTPQQMEWEGEQLPPNAIGARGGRSDRRSRSGRARDRRLSRLEDESNDERSRSRSTSPKRLGVNPDGSSLRGRSYGLRDSSHLNPSRLEAQTSTTSLQRRASEDAARPNGTATADESTPLLRTKSSATLENGEQSTRRASRSSKSDASVFGQGSSTFLQSWFNSLNALVGVGILALPLAFSYAGWIGGTVLFLLCGALTNYTGKVLASIMAKEPSLRTYADIGTYAFGPSARLVVSLFFCLELWAVSVALIILFGDSMYAIVGGLSPAIYKAIGLVIILPTTFLPLKWLSPVSVIGIVSTFTLFAVVLADGLIKKEAPGSLWQPGPTHLGPDWSRVPLSFGLIMSGFSSHPIIPSLVKDMRNPSDFPRMLNLAYLGATVVYLSMGMVGYAMFGSHVSGEITNDLASTNGYPRQLTHLAVWLIALNPLTKFALATRPINTTIETLCGLETPLVRRSRRRSSTTVAKQRVTGPSVTNSAGSEPQLASEGSGVSQNPSNASSDPELTPRASDHSNPLAGSAIAIRSAELTAGCSPVLRGSLRVVVKVVVAALVTLTAVLLPGFEKVMAFLGAFLASSTCVFGPLLANLKVNHSILSRTRVVIDIIILAITSVAAVTGTIWSFKHELTIAWTAVAGA